MFVLNILQDKIIMIDQLIFNQKTSMCTQIYHNILLSQNLFVESPMCSMTTTGELNLSWLYMISRGAACWYKDPGEPLVFEVGYHPPKKNLFN